MAEYACLLPPSWRSKVTEWIDEDIPSFDYGGFVVGDKEDHAVLWGKTKVLFLFLFPFFLFLFLLAHLCFQSLSLSERVFWLASHLWMRSSVS